MSWRVALGAFAGLLLPLPLMLLLSGVMHPAPRGGGPAGARVSPVLDGEERMRRVTYRRECALSAECEPPLGCLTDGRRRDQYCTDSQCMRDEECPEAHVCQDLATTGGGPLVRFFVAVGVRKEGDTCGHTAG